MAWSSGILSMPAQDLQDIQLRRREREQRVKGSRRLG
jgi:hypothetical protein